jgi:membrane protein implicated in regulation of membrane protease activity
MAWFLNPALQPFTIAAAVLLALVAIQVIGTLAGATLTEWTESDLFGDMAGTPLGWLNVGRVPLLILLMLLLGLFAAGGMVLQAIAEPVTGLIPPLPATAAAGAFALIATRSASRHVARVLPREETYVLSEEDLVGRVGTVTVGPLESHAVGRIRVSDVHGNRHFPRARPAEAGDVIETGAHVLIVALAGREYRVIRAPEELAGLDETT